MIFRILRSIPVALLFVALAVQAEEPKKCSATARECEQEIRRMLAGRRYLGLQVVELPHGGIIVKTVNDDGPAGRIKDEFMAGDRIIGINGRDMTLATAKEFKQALADAKETGVLFVILQRRGAYRKVNTKLEPYPKAQIDKIIEQHLLKNHSGTQQPPSQTTASNQK